MSEASTLILSLTIYKVATFLAGLAFAFMGYRLFVQGVFLDAGELRTSWDNRSLVLKKAAPGTFFAILGTVIVCDSLWRGLTFEPQAQGAGIGGSGFFSFGTSKRDNHSASGASAEQLQTLHKDIAILNRLVSELVVQRERGDAPDLTVSIEDREWLIDLVDRAKGALILSTWSAKWGDPKEFKNWAYHAPGYPYSEPPKGNAQAVAIFKGEGK